MCVCDTFFKMRTLHELLNYFFILNESVHFLILCDSAFAKSGKLYVYPNKIAKTVHMVTGFSSSSHSEDKLCV